jgi:predicted nucleic acid-binding protein
MNLPMTPVYVLDSCALLAAYKQEPGCDVVSALYEMAADNQITLRLNMVTLLEIYYNIIYEYDVETAKERLSEIQNSKIKITNLTLPILTEAGRLKTTYRISLADSIALAEASVSKGTLVTADHHEMDSIEPSEPNINFLWIR